MPKNTPQRRIDSRRQNRATTISGVTLSAPAGVTDHGLLLGLGDDDHSQYLLANGTRTLAGNLAVASGITIDGIDLSAHAADPAAHHALATAGNSGISVAGQAISLAAAAAGAGLAYAAGVLSINVAGLGMSVAADAVTLSSSSNPGAAAAILASDASGYLNLVRLVLSDRLRTPTIDTASGPLTLDPAGDVVSLAASTAVQTANYASQLTGWRATYAGEGDFRYLFVDEMHAKSFIADLEQALAGGQIISKSVAMVAEAFTVPAAGAAATLRVRDLPSAANMAAFQSGDIVRLRTFSRSGGSLTIADAWGVVTSYADGTGANEGTQTWTFTRSSAPNAGAMTAGTVIQPDSIVLDYGTTGNGYYEVNAIDGAYGLNSPYARIVSWTTHPATGQALRVQMGNLRGVYGYASSIYGIAMGDPTAANVTVEASNGVRLRQGTTDMIVLDASGNSYFAGVMTIGTSGEIRQGTGTLGSNFTGLRVWRDSNVGRIGGYASNVLQWYGDTAGNLVAGTGYVTLNASGIDVASYHDSRTSTPEPGYSDPISNPSAALTYHASDQGEAWFSAVDGWKTYVGGTALRMFGSSRHAVDSGQPATNWSHYVDAVLEMPGVTKPSSTGSWFERLWLKAPSTSVVLVAGNVGIGTATPTAQLTLQKAVASSTYVARLLLEDTGTVSDTKSGIDWYNTTHNWMQGRISVERQSTTNSFDMVFSTSTTGSLVETLRLTQEGYVGINTTSPGARLDVNGSFRALGASYFNGTIAAGSWHVYIAGATGAARDLLLVGQSGYSNGMTVQYDGSQMVFGFAGGPIRVGNTSDLYSAKIQTNGNIHAQGAVTTELYMQMATASTPAAATGFIRMWFDGTNIKAILPGGTTKTLSWT